MSRDHKANLRERERAAAGRPSHPGPSKEPDSDPDSGPRARSIREDKEAVIRVLEGDREAYRILVEKYQSWVFHTCLRIIRDRDEAEDLAQETFMKAYTNLRRYDPRWAFSTWLMTIATRAALNAARQRRNRATISLEDLAVTPADAETSDRHPARGTEYIEWMARLKQEMGALGDQMRLIFGMRYEDDMSITEIARETKASESNVKVILHRARKILRSKLREFSDLL